MFFQEAPPDTSSYMIAGYAVFFVISAIYLLSLILRQRNLERDLEALDAIKAESRQAPGGQRRAPAARAKQSRKKVTSQKIGAPKPKSTIMKVDFGSYEFAAVTLRRRSAIFTNLLAALAIAVGSQYYLPATPVSAATEYAPPGPDRITPITVDFTAYTWWMANFDDNRVECSLTIDHEGMPTLGEIYIQCGESIYFDYKEQPPCYAGGHANTCEGYYLYMIDSQISQKVITVKLPQPDVWLTLEGCSAVSRQGTSICEVPPILVLEGREPLPNEHILAIEGTIDGTAFSCEPTCKIELQATDDDGLTMEFWAWSSYGDSSPAFTAQVRVAQAAENNPDDHFWYIDVLSTQWQGVRTASCSATWDSFPPVGGPPAWLGSPARKVNSPATSRTTTWRPT